MSKKNGIMSVKAFIRKPSCSLLPNVATDLHKLLHWRVEGDVVKGVSGLERLVCRMMHHSRRQCVKRDEVSYFTCKCKENQRLFYNGSRYEEKERLRQTKAE